MKFSILFLAIFSLPLSACTSPVDPPGKTDIDPIEEVLEDLSNQTTELELPGGIMETNGIKHSVDLNDVLGGGPAKDGIPSIDNPKFISVEEADTWADPEGLGVALSINGVERFYPFQILVWHEIVNDELGGQAALITYCPLCGSGIVFDPIVNGEETEFGTSGKLWQSNLVMYDRQTDSYWSQILGEAIVGEMTGTRLDLLPHQNLRWKDWKLEHPDGEVLSKDTGFSRDYSRTPYTNYDTNESIFFDVQAEDDRYHPKATLYGLLVEGETKAYLIEELNKLGESNFTDTIGNIELEISYNTENETVVFTRTDTNEEVVPFFSFWFAWFAAHPETDVFSGLN